MAAHGHRSSFDDALDDVEFTANPKDATEVMTVRAVVDQKLTNRFPEESHEEGDFKLHYAAPRIEGAIERGKQHRRAALAYGALPEFVAVIDAILSQAQAALVVAKPPSPPSVSKTPGTWTQTPVTVGPDPDDPIYQLLRDV